MSSLGTRQEAFMRLLPRLIDKAHELGFEIRGGDLFRDKRVHGEYGVKRSYASAYSKHKLKLAIDLFLTKDGVYLTATEDYKVLGLWWESLDPLCEWGGHFNDGNHFQVKAP